MEALLTVVSNIWDSITGSNGLVSVMIATPILLIPLAFLFARRTISATRSLLGTGGGRRR